MSLSTIRSKIKTEIEEVITSSIGTVYDYKRFSNDLVTYKDLFIRGSKVNTWEIERNSFSKTVHGGDRGKEDSIHNFTIRGFYSFDDSAGSDKVFQDSYVEVICQKFTENPTLDGIADIVNMPITGTITMGKLGDVLVHICEIQLSIMGRRLF